MATDNFKSSQGTIIKAVPAWGICLPISQKLALGCGGRKNSKSSLLQETGNKRERKEKAAPMSANLPFKTTQAKRRNMFQALKESFSPGISCSVNPFFRNKEKKSKQ